MLILDLGGVVLDVDRRLGEQAFRRAGAGPALDGFFSSGIKDRMDRGELSADAALAALSAGTGVAPAVLEAAWCALLVPRTAVLDALRRLAGRTRLAVLSNTDPIHARHLQRTLGLADAVQDWIFSFQAGALKPDPAVFRYALERLGVDAREAAFVDDRSGNVAAARALGLRARRASTPTEVLATLDAWGLGA